MNHPFLTRPHRTLLALSAPVMVSLPDGQSILVNGSDLTARALWHQPFEGAPRRLDLGDIHAETPVVAPDGTVVFVGVETHRPAGLYTMRVGEWEPRRLTSFNDALADMKHGEVETVIWDGPARVAVSGWSYGGYMTTWLTAHFDGRAAAVAGAAVTDWFDWYNMADYNVWSGYGLGGSPWLNDNAMNYWRQSPRAYAHQIRTPTLILSDTGDERVTVSQSYKLYHALKDNKVEVKFIAYPVPGH